MSKEQPTKKPITPKDKLAGNIVATTSRSWDQQEELLEEAQRSAEALPLTLRSFITPPGGEGRQKGYRRIYGDQVRGDFRATLFYADENGAKEGFSESILKNERQSGPHLSDWEYAQYVKKSYLLQYRIPIVVKMVPKLVSFLEGIISNLDEAAKANSISEYEYGLVIKWLEEVTQGVDKDKKHNFFKPEVYKEFLRLPPNVQVLLIKDPRSLHVQSGQRSVRLSYQSEQVESFVEGMKTDLHNMLTAEVEASAVAYMVEKKAKSWPKTKEVLKHLKSDPNFGHLKDDFLQNVVGDVKANLDKNPNFPVFGRNNDGATASFIVATRAFELYLQDNHIKKKVYAPSYIEECIAAIDNALCPKYQKIYVSGKSEFLTSLHKHRIIWAEERQEDLEHLINVLAREVLTEDQAIDRITKRLSPASIVPVVESFIKNWELEKVAKGLADGVLKFLSVDENVQKMSVEDKDTILRGIRRGFVESFPEPERCLSNKNVATSKGHIAQHLRDKLIAPLTPAATTDSGKVKRKKSLKSVSLFNTISEAEVRDITAGAIVTAKASFDEFRRLSDNFEFTTQVIKDYFIIENIKDADEGLVQQATSILNKRITPEEREKGRGYLTTSPADTDGFRKFARSLVRKYKCVTYLNPKQWLEDTLFDGIIDNIRSDAKDAYDNESVTELVDLMAGVIKQQIVANVQEDDVANVTRYFSEHEKEAFYERAKLDLFRGKHGLLLFRIYHVHSQTVERDEQESPAEEVIPQVLEMIHKHLQGKQLSEVSALLEKDIASFRKWIAKEMGTEGIDLLMRPMGYMAKKTSEVLVHDKLEGLEGDPVVIRFTDFMRLAIKLAIKSSEGSNNDIWQKVFNPSESVENICLKLKANIEQNEGRYVSPVGLFAFRALDHYMNIYSGGPAATFPSEHILASYATLFPTINVSEIQKKYGIDITSGRIDEGQLQGAVDAFVRDAREMKSQFLYELDPTLQERDAAQRANLSTSGSLIYNQAKQGKLSLLHQKKKRVYDERLHGQLPSASQVEEEQVGQTFSGIDFSGLGDDGGQQGLDDSFDLLGGGIVGGCTDFSEEEDSLVVTTHWRNAVAGDKEHGNQSLQGQRVASNRMKEILEKPHRGEGLKRSESCPDFLEL